MGECWRRHVPQTLPPRTHEPPRRRSPGKGHARSGENPPTNSDGSSARRAQTQKGPSVTPSSRGPSTRRILLGPHRGAAESRPHLARPDADRRGPAPGCQAPGVGCAHRLGAPRRQTSRGHVLTHPPAPGSGSPGAGLDATSDPRVIALTHSSAVRRDHACTASCGPPPARSKSMQKALPACLPVVGAPTPESSSTPLCALSPRFSLGVKGRGDPQGHSGSQATRGGNGWVGRNRGQFPEKTSPAFHAIFQAHPEMEPRTAGQPGWRGGCRSARCVCAGAPLGGVLGAPRPTVLHQAGPPRRGAQGARSQVPPARTPRPRAGF